MTQSTLLERKRKALVNAKLDSLKSKYGVHTDIVTVKNTKYRLDLDEEVLTNALIHHFERSVRLSLKGQFVAEGALIKIYENFYTKFGNLTEEGEAFMTEILENVAQKTEPIT
ncbi:hypothetical protein [Xenorhabdus taiwanensis]|uniref:Phage protein n=1 Tax=Xenorhabdus taiwanensis TaxID=3085177 RepID=A0ABN7C6X7_9GAMM|nr:hypothetical protein TCT1_30560 [Xenorhabdus sp. TCT-1]